MLQVYSSNATVAANTAYSLDNVVLDKGCAENTSGTSTIALQRKGVYLVKCDGFCTPSSAGPVTTQLYVNGVAQPQAISSFTGTTSTIGEFAFSTTIQVTENNCNCNCTSSPTLLQFINGDTPVESAHINVVVTKLC